MCSELVEKARSSAECHERIQPGGNPPLHFPLCLTTGLLFTHRSEVRGHSEGQRAKAPPAAAGPADAAAQHCHLGEPDGSGRTHPAVPSGKCPAEASARPHCDSRNRLATPPQVDERIPRGGILNLRKLLKSGLMQNIFASEID